MSISTKNNYYCYVLFFKMKRKSNHGCMTIVRQRLVRTNPRDQIITDRTNRNKRHVLLIEYRFLDWFWTTLYQTRYIVIVILFSDSVLYSKYIENNTHSKIIKD